MDASYGRSGGGKPVVLFYPGVLAGVKLGRWWLIALLAAVVEINLHRLRELSLELGHRTPTLPSSSPLFPTVVIPVSRRVPFEKWGSTRQVITFMSVFSSF